MRKSHYLRMLLGLVLVVAVLLGTVLGSCAKPAPTLVPTPAAAPKPTEAPWPKALTFAAPTSTGTEYVIQAGLSDMATKYLKIPASVEVSGGAVATQDLLAKGMVNICSASGVAAVDAYLGIRSQTKSLPVRAIMRGHEAIFQLLTLATSGIKTVADMNGRKYQFDKAGSVNRDLGYTLIKCAKLEVKLIPWESTQDACDSVAAGRTDVSQTSAVGAGAVRELVTKKDIYFIPIPEDVRDCMVKTYVGYAKKTLHKGTYSKSGVDNPPADVPAIGADAWVYCLDTLPDSLVYEFTKAILDHPDEFKNYHSEAKYYRLDRATGDPIMPFHPGAIKYYKEKGVWTDASQKLQDKLLKEQPKS